LRRTKVNRGELREQAKGRVNMGNLSIREPGETQRNW